MVTRRHSAPGVALSLLVLLALSSFQIAPAHLEVSKVRAPALVANAADLACFSDGVACSHSVDCCSGGCVRGQCGARSKLKRRLARR